MTSGTNSCVSTASQAGNANFSAAANVARTVVAAKAVLELVADDKSKTYGQDNPALTFSVVGLTNGDTKATALTADPTLDTAAVKASNAGSYAITITGGTSAKYTLTRTIGTLTVGWAALTVTADNRTVQYSDPTPAFTSTMSGFVPGQNASALSGTLSVSSSRTAASPVGSYGIAAAGLTSTTTPSPSPRARSQ